MRLRQDLRRDEGFTLAELMVALGVFSVLAVISGAAMLSVMTGIRTVSSGTELQVEAQNSAVWVSRLARYADAPPGVDDAFLAASPTDLEFYSWAGAGPDSDAPYLVRLAVEMTESGAQVLISETTPGIWSSGSWMWPMDRDPDATTRRLLLEVGSDEASPANFELWACNPSAGCANTARKVTPASLGPVLLEEGERLFALDIALGQTDDDLAAVIQRVNLVNLS